MKREIVQLCLPKRGLHLYRWLLSFSKNLVVIHIIFDRFCNKSSLIFLHMSSRSSQLTNVGYTHFGMVPPNVIP